MICYAEKNHSNAGTVVTTPFEMKSHAVDPSAQGALFASDDWEMPQNLATFRKAVSAIHAVPIKAEHNHTLNTRRLLDSVILCVQLDFRKRGREQVERILAERISPIFEVRTSELMKIAGISGKNYNRVYEDLEHLFQMVLKWNVVGEDSGILWDMKAHFLSSFGVGKGPRLGYVRFSLDPSVLEIVMEPRMWATLSLSAIKELKTPASYALFQNVFRYANTQNKVSAALPTETWIELLVGTSKYIDVDAETGKTVTNYHDFKRRCLLDAIERVNNAQALGYTIELKEIRSGTKIAKLQFKLIPKQQASLGLPLAWPEKIITTLQMIGFSEQEISDLSQAHSFEEVADALIRMQKSEAKIREQGKQIFARKLYFNGILANVAAGSPDNEIDQDALRAKEAERQAQERQERMRELFAKHQSSVFTERLFELPDAQRAAITDEFESSADGKSVKLLLSKKGWNAKNVGAVVMLRKWAQDSKPSLLSTLLCNPEDTDFEAWLAWRLDQMDAAN